MAIPSADLWLLDSGSSGAPDASKLTNASQATLRFDGDNERSFTLDSNTGQWLGSGGDTLTASPVGAITAGTVFIYQAAGSDERLQLAFISGTPDANHWVLARRIARNGWTQNYGYGLGNVATPGGVKSALQLTAITNAFGRKIRLQYHDSGDWQGQLAQAQNLAPDGSVVESVSYAYDSVAAPAGSGATAPIARLISITRTNPATGAALLTTTYHYEAAASGSTFTAGLLTGLSQQGQRLETYTYDSQNRPVTSARALGADKVTVSYSGSLVNGIYSSASITDALGVTRTYAYDTAAHNLNVTSASQIPAQGYSPVKSRAVDARGLVTQETDFRGYSMTRSYDTARPLLLQETRAANQTGQSQTTQTDWHDTFNLPVRITEAGAQGNQRITEYTYDTRGNRLSETISGTGITPRTRAWSYTAQNLVASETDEAGQVTTHGYNPWGNLTASTDPLGRATTYTHDAAGRLLTQTDPAGVLTAYTYDPRGLVLTQTVGSLTTTMSYLSTGLLGSVRQPSGYQISYQYDAAQRLTGWSDNRGNSGAYVLDGMGNRVSEQTKDAQGQVAFELSRTINAINRVASQTVGGNQGSTYQYDANGDLTGITNGLNQNSTYGLDALRRLASEKNPQNATATLTYDSLNGITQASDFKGVATTYTRDAQGNATQESSPDIGTQQGSHDARGLPASSQDGAGRSQHITRDALGRATTVQASAGSASLNSTLSYDNASGQISQIQEPALSTGYQRDSLGRITRKSQSVGGN